MTLYDKLDKLHERSERRRKTTTAQRKKAYMHSTMVIREVTQSMMPKGIKWDNDHYRTDRAKGRAKPMDVGKIRIRSHVSQGLGNHKVAEEAKTDEITKIQNNIRL